MTDSRLLTTAQAAELLGVSRSTVGRWADSGVLDAIRTPGNHRRIPADSVRALRLGRTTGRCGDRPPGHSLPCARPPLHGDDHESVLGHTWPNTPT